MLENKFKMGKKATNSKRDPLNLKTHPKKQAAETDLSYKDRALYEHRADMGRRFTVCLAHNPASSPSSTSPVTLQAPPKFTLSNFPPCVPALAPSCTL